VPNLIDLPKGCTFAPRCRPRVEHELTICEEAMPDMLSVSKGHEVRCWLYQDDKERKQKAPLKV
jgi:peptide/nickel transport system ATP-binding protein